jgi:hypothetical protein
MFGWSVGALVAGGFLAIGGSQIGVLLTERRPTTLSCRALLEAGTRARWVRLSGCTPAWENARPFKDRRFREGLYVPLGPPGTNATSNRLLARVESAADRNAGTWEGLLDVRGTEKRPPFASVSTRILYVDRPDAWEVTVSVAAPVLYAVAGTLALRRRARRKVARGNVARRFRPVRDSLPTDLCVLNLDPLLGARRTIRRGLAATVAALVLLLVPGLISLQGASSPLMALVATVPVAACAVTLSVFWWKRSPTPRRLAIITTLAFILATVLLALSVANARGDRAEMLAAAAFAAAFVAIAILTMKTRRRLLLQPDWARLADVDGAVTRVLARRVPRHETLRRRPAEIVLYKSAALAIGAVGLIVALLTQVKPLAWVAGAVGILLWRRARRHASLDAREVQEKDPRPPVVLLRSFADDELEMSGLPELMWSPPTTMSWVAAERLASIGPVVAVGEPGEELPPLGPYRLFLPAGNWQVEVERLISSARAVFLVLGRSRGVLWELERILAREHPGGVTVIVPPAEPGDLEQRWEAFLALAKDHRVWRLAQHLDPTTLLLVRAMDGGPALAIGASRPNGAAYAMAFSVCAALEAGTLQPPMS